MKNMNFKTITYVAAAVMAASCGNSSNKTAEQVATANEPRLVNLRVLPERQRKALTFIKENLHHKL